MLDYLGFTLLFIVAVQGQWASPYWVPMIPSYSNCVSLFVLLNWRLSELDS